LVLGSPQFTVKNGDGQNTTSATTTYVLHDVPASIGQSIVDAWLDGTTHRRAGSIGGYSATGGMCTVNLSVTPVVDQRIEFSNWSQDGYLSLIVQDEGQIDQLTTDNALMTALTHNSFSGGKSSLLGRYNYGIIIKSNTTEFERWPAYVLGPMQCWINRKKYTAYVYVRVFASQSGAATWCNTKWADPGNAIPSPVPAPTGTYTIVSSIDGHKTGITEWKQNLYHAVRVEVDLTGYEYDE
jgi:hypothetical protein